MEEQLKGEYELEKEDGKKERERTWCTEGVETKQKEKLEDRD